MNLLQELIRSRLIGGGGEAVLIQKTITANGTFAAADDNADGYSSVTVDVPVGVPFYSGTLTLVSRPTAAGAFATLDAPNCTHFVMYAGDTPDYTTGKAFFGFAIVEKDQAALALSSNNSGTNFGTSSAAISWSFDSQTDLLGITIVFGERNIELLTTYVGDTEKLPQAGLDYKWFAW